MLRRSLILLSFSLAWLLDACGPPAGEKLSIVFTGDVLLDRGVLPVIRRQGVEALFASVSPLFRQADATVINLECPLTDRQEPLHKQFVFRSSPSYAAALRKAGITHAALANNHTMDQGRAGLADTDRYLREAGITPLGYGANAAASTHPVLIRKGRLCVALFNSVTVPIENWVYVDDRPTVCQSPLDTLAAAIHRYKQSHPRHKVVAVLHWGIEYQPQPSLEQRRGAYLLAQAGADAVIGHHPHVLQPEVSVLGKPVFYSLGNFVFDQHRPSSCRSRIVRLDFTVGECRPAVYPVRIEGCKPRLLPEGE